MDNQEGLGIGEGGGDIRLAARAQIREHDPSDPPQWAEIWGQEDIDYFLEQFCNDILKYTFLIYKSNKYCISKPF